MNIVDPTQILAAYAEPAAGPGWANTPIWIIIRDRDGVLRQECLQPDEQSPEMRMLYRCSAVAHNAMTAAVKAVWGKP